MAATGAWLSLLLRPRAADALQLDVVVRQHSEALGCRARRACPETPAPPSPLSPPLHAPCTVQRPCPSLESPAAVWVRAVAWREHLVQCTVARALVCTHLGRGSERVGGRPGTERGVCTLERLAAVAASKKAKCEISVAVRLTGCTPLRKQLCATSRRPPGSDGETFDLLPVCLAPVPAHFQCGTCLCRHRMPRCDRCRWLQRQQPAYRVGSHVYSKGMLFSLVTRSWGNRRGRTDHSMHEVLSLRRRRRLRLCA
jgi:hypothetical protein